MQQLQTTQTGLKEHASNPLLGVTFGFTDKIISICMDIVETVVQINAVFSSSTCILGAVVEIKGGSCTLSLMFVLMNQGVVMVLYSTVNYLVKVVGTTMTVSSFTESHICTGN